MFFIHKFTDGAIVKFTKVPQVKHKVLDTFDCIPGDFIRTMQGRVAVIRDIRGGDLYVSDFHGRLIRKPSYFFSLRFLDDGELMETRPQITMAKVKVKFIDLLFYKIYTFIIKK